MINNDKILIITDTHFGAKSDNQIILEYQKRFYETIFFPYIDKHQIDTIIHMGDLVERRKYVNFYTAKRLDEDFMKPIFDRNIDFHIICGNHDIFFKNTNEQNSITQLYPPSKFPVQIYTRPTEVQIKGVNMLMMPWICDDNYEDSMKLAQTSNAEYLISHLELAGFEMDRGNVAYKGMDKEIFDRFPKVFSGHYHHKSKRDNITYLGAPCQYTWIDYDDPKGFHVLDAKTRELDYVRNPLEVYKKFYYDDTSKSTPESMLAFDTNLFKGAYTKIIVKNKNDPYLFDMLCEKIDSAYPADVQIVEDYVDLVDDAMNFDEENMEAQDTISLTKKYISAIETNNVDRNKLEQFMINLYVEALNQES